MRYAGGRGAGIEELARDTGPEFEAVIAGGGDGTVDAVLNGLVESSSAATLGILPLGTVNLVAREVGLPRDPEHLAATIAAGPARPVWPGRVGRRFFTVVAGCGFDADIVAAVDPLAKARFGRIAFAPAILRTLSKKRPRMLAVNLDGDLLSASAVIVAKGRYYAGPFSVAPGALLTEPALYAVLFRSGGRGAILRYLAAIACGASARLPDVAIRRCMTVSVSGDDTARVQADGELIATTLPVTIALSDRPVDLIWPE